MLQTHKNTYISLSIRSSYRSSANFNPPLNINLLSSSSLAHLSLSLDFTPCGFTMGLLIMGLWVHSGFGKQFSWENFDKSQSLGASVTDRKVGLRSTESGFWGLNYWGWESSLFFMWGWILWWKEWERARVVHAEREREKSFGVCWPKEEAGEWMKKNWPRGERKW